MTYKRTDDNQTEIVKTFRALGCSVQSIAMVGKGCPDLLVGRDGWTVPVEVKDGSKSPSQRKLTDLEEYWKLNWKGSYALVESPEQAHQLVAEMMLTTALKCSGECCGRCRPPS
jgi:Holliday junction resolvase